MELSDQISLQDLQGHITEELGFYFWQHFLDSYLKGMSMLKTDQAGIDSYREAYWEMVDEDVRLMGKACFNRLRLSEDELNVKDLKEGLLFNTTVMDKVESDSKLMLNKRMLS